MTMTCLIGIALCSAAVSPSVLATVAPAVKVHDARDAASGSAATGEGHAAPLDDDALLDEVLDALLDELLVAPLDPLVEALLEAPPAPLVVEVLVLPRPPAPPTPPAVPVLVALVLAAPPLPVLPGPAPDACVAEGEPELPHAGKVTIPRSASAAKAR
jgi:hypothetical protein